MVNELKQAVDKVEKLSERDQQAIARLILDEIEWSQTFQESQNALLTLAEKAISEFKAGKTKPLDLNE
jgi:aspartate/glutamate racemase